MVSMQIIFAKITKDLVQNNQEIIQTDVMALDFITYIFTLDPNN